MKQIYSTLAGLLFLSCCLSAQITINAEDIPEVGISAEQTTDTLPDISIQAGGDGLQSWDFTALKDERPGVFAFLSPDATPYDDLFPNANLATEVDTIGFLYLHKNDDRIEILGTYGVVNFQGVQLEVKVDLIPPQSLIRFPATFGDSYDETVDQFIQMPGSNIGAPFDSVRNVTTTERMVNIDAYGEMTTPAGTFETIRSTEAEIGISRSYILNSGNWQLVDESQPDTTINYNWWTIQNDLAFPIVQLGYDPITGEREVTWLKDFTTATEEAFTLKVSLYPNPAGDYINIGLPEPMEGSFNLMEVNGRMVKSQPIGSQSDQIDIGNLSPGTYLLTVSDKRGKLVGFKKFEKLRN